MQRTGREPFSKRKSLLCDTVPCTALPRGCAARDLSRFVLRTSSAHSFGPLREGFGSIPRPLEGFCVPRYCAAVLLPCDVRCDPHALFLCVVRSGGVRPAQSGTNACVFSGALIFCSGRPSDSGSSVAFRPRPL